MSYMHRAGDKRKSVDEMDYDDGQDDIAMSPGSPRSGQPMESDKRLRREIANSNERRRMQSINAGFESLKTLIPHHREEKLSKAAILQQTSEYVSTLENEKTRLVSQNNVLRKALKDMDCNPDTIVGPLNEQISPSTATTVPPAAKRKKRDTESSDEGISLGFDDMQLDELRKEVVELRLQLERERKLRQVLEGTGTNSAAAAASVPPPAAPIHCPPPPPPQHKASPPPHIPVVIPHKPVTTVPDPILVKQEVIMSPRSTVPRHVPVFNSSMSKRNLETIVEAIRHLEGEHILSDLRLAPSHPAALPRTVAPPPRIDDSSASLSAASSSSSLASSDEAADLLSSSPSSASSSPAHVVVHTMPITPPPPPPRRLSATWHPTLHHQ